jgi:peptidoglycan/LPS O-acetylase OafA/YrhL
VLVPIAALSGAAALDVGDVLLHAALLFNLVDNASLYNPVHWSLPVEWNFYLVLPLLALPFARRGGAIAAVLLMLAFAIGFRIACVAVVFDWGDTGWRCIAGSSSCRAGSTNSPSAWRPRGAI